MILSVLFCVDVECYLDEIMDCRGNIWIIGLVMRFLDFAKWRVMFWYELRGSMDVVLWS